MQRMDSMADQLFHPSPSRKAAIDEKTKIAKLREQRLASDAARREAGTWGDLSVGEIVHGLSGEVFVLSWRGRMEPDLMRLKRTRSSEISVSEHERLQEWLTRRAHMSLTRSLVGWNLSRAEARRVKEARIAEHKATGRHVVNDGS
jgi:hypothetical protein